MANLIKLSEPIALPEIPKDWNSEKSIAYLKPLLESWKRDTIAIAKELYRANQIFSASGRRTDLGSKRSEVATWEQLIYSPSSIILIAFSIDFLNPDLSRNSSRISNTSCVFSSNLSGPSFPKYFSIA